MCVNMRLYQNDFKICLITYARTALPLKVVNQCSCVFDLLNEGKVEVGGKLGDDDDDCYLFIIFISSI